jgi:hypothetical protein
MGGPSAPIAPDGTFTIKNVPPGEYRLLAQTTVEGADPGVQVPEAVTMLITVDGADIANLALSASAGWSASGRIVTESGGPPSLPASQVRLVGRFVDTDTAPTRTGAFQNQDSGRVKDDWTFALTALFGATRLRVTLPDGWMVKSIFRNGADISDAAVEAKSGEQMTDLQVVITDRVTAVSGRLVNDKGAPAVDGTVIVFSEDAEKWAEDSRWVRSARPDQQGQYQIKGLPPGRYLAVAVDYVESGLWNDPEYLVSAARTERCPCPARARGASPLASIVMTFRARAARDLTAGRAGGCLRWRGAICAAARAPRAGGRMGRASIPPPQPARTMRPPGDRRPPIDAHRRDPRCRW